LNVAPVAFQIGFHRSYVNGRPRSSVKIDPSSAGG
jgi:hypothetical protein